MTYALQVSVGPNQEPVSLAEARAHLRVDGYDDDATIAALIIAARTHVESITARALCTQTLVMSFDDFEDDEYLELPRSPAQSVTSITYIDANGTTQTWSAANYKLDGHSFPARISPAYGYTFPVARDELNSCTVTYVAGYGGSHLVPEPIKQAILLLVGAWFENREAVLTGTIVATLPFAVDALLAPYRVVYL
ncbi:Phage conserved hypothetical protein [uncultured Caudovirales phage]|uniref:Gp6 domain containing protein n=1 Tax=uncultured Caudovirales phage TaxID=2100421 RepID=A0A6J5N300_9CAUD|nr:Phage conserved hypothetical protein [uncultured Caudovirales phage]